MALLYFIFPLSIQSGQINYIYTFQVKTEFGISLVMGANSSMYNYGLVTKSGTEVLSTQTLTEQSFIMQIMGKMQSKANPKMINLLKPYVKDTCECIIDDVYKKYYGYKCHPIDILWKVRYAFDPRQHKFKQYDIYKGWAVNHYGPSEKQGAYLCERYKIKGLNEYITGANLYQLIQDVQDSVWIDNYRLME